MRKRYVCLALIALICLAAAVLLLLCVCRKEVLNRLHGAIMLLCYGGYFAYLML